MTSKVLTNVFNKALATGEGNVNGRVHYEYGIMGELESKYKLTIEPEGTISFKHWGTETMRLEYVGDAYLITAVYGESKSDRDSLTDMLRLLKDKFIILNGEINFHYFPSTGEFVTLSNHAGKIITF